MLNPTDFIEVPKWRIKQRLPEKKISIRSPPIGVLAQCWQCRETERLESISRSIIALFSVLFIIFDHLGEWIGLKWVGDNNHSQVNQMLSHFFRVSPLARTPMFQKPWNKRFALFRGSGLRSTTAGGGDRTRGRKPNHGHDLYRGSLN